MFGNKKQQTEELHITNLDNINPDIRDDFFSALAACKDLIVNAWSKFSKEETSNIIEALKYFGSDIATKAAKAMLFDGDPTEIMVTRFKTLADKSIFVQSLLESFGFIYAPETDEIP